VIKITSLTTILGGRFTISNTHKTSSQDIFNYFQKYYKLPTKKTRYIPKDKISSTSTAKAAQV